MAESNRSIVERFEKAFAANDIAGIQDACHPDLFDHNPLPDQKPGLSGFKETVAFYTSVFPDSQVETIRRSPTVRSSSRDGRSQ